MKYTGPGESISIAAGIVVASIVIFLTLRAFRAEWPLAADEVTRVRLRRVNVCFALFGGLFLAMSWAQAQPWEISQGATAMVGIYLAAPMVCVAGPIALYNSVLLWRANAVRVLWIIALLLMCVILAEDILSAWLGATLELVCVVSIIALAFRGLFKGRRRQAR